MSNNNIIELAEDLGKMFRDNIEQSFKKNQKSGVRGFIVDIMDDELKITPNSTCVGGRRFIQEKIHGTRPLAGQRYTANEHWDIFKDITPTKEDEHNRKICAFGIGIGGCGDVFSTIVPSTEEDIFLNSAIPFINIDISKYPDLDPEERAKYYGRRLYDANGTTYIQYWLKKIESAPISLEKGKNIYEPSAADIGSGLDEEDDGGTTALSVGQIECTTFYTLEVLPQELKDYFRMIHNSSVAQCRFNELAVFFGYEKEVVSSDGVTYTELLATEAFSHVTLDNQAHTKATDLAKFIYYFSS